MPYHTPVLSVKIKEMVRSRLSAARKRSEVRLLLPLWDDRERSAVEGVLG
jgi:hypothetical protein